MDLFEAFFARHGETGIQAILENWERFRGIRYSDPLPLEKRWEIFLQATAGSVAVDA